MKGNPKLTEPLVKRIKNMQDARRAFLDKASCYSNQRIAEKTGVSLRQVQRIDAGTAWWWVNNSDGGDEDEY